MTYLVLAGISPLKANLQGKVLDNLKLLNANRDSILGLRIQDEVKLKSSTVVVGHSDSTIII